MGGQTASEKTTHIDMRGFSKILRFDKKKKTITVQSGTRWRDIQDFIDPHDLSVKIMQTYSNFTVGGSLSVNVHGRYVGGGPLINSVESIRILLADGRDILASRSENSEIFYSALGGYGGIGIILEATLHLVRNEKIRREISIIQTDQYKRHFSNNIKNNPNAVLHNGDIYPPSFETVRSETWIKTDDELTIKERLIPRNKKYWLEPNVISSISILPFGTEIRRNVLEPQRDGKKLVTWRNYEASYDVAQLEPTTPRLVYTYVLQEYFVPVDNFDLFILKMRRVFQKHGVNVLNVSIRHSPAEKDTYLSWAQSEVFSFVIYYKQGTSKSAQKNVKMWTMELIDEVLSVQGTYYLPYQIHATSSQFQKAYPGYKKFFDLKKKLDPNNRFRNTLWDTYYVPQEQK